MQQFLKQQNTIRKYKDCNEFCKWKELNMMTVYDWNTRMDYQRIFKVNFHILYFWKTGPYLLILQFDWSMWIILISTLFFVNCGIEGDYTFRHSYMHIHIWLKHQTCINGIFLYNGQTKVKLPFLITIITKSSR